MADVHLSESELEPPSKALTDGRPWRIEAEVSSRSNMMLRDLKNLKNLKKPVFSWPRTGKMCHRWRCCEA